MAGLFLLALTSGSLLLLSEHPSQACSIFSFASGTDVVYGQNLDWADPTPGHVVVNQRGVRKAILPWKGWWPAPGERETSTWTSRYGSVTFTCWGRDFIDGGMNEAGLIVDEANLVAIYPPDDGRPGVSCAQWMQYQLDCFSTVEEVLAHLDDLRPDGEGWHYLVADRSGGAAVIEYLDGKPTIYTAEALEVAALTNTTYKQAMSHIPMDKAFGGEIDVAAGSDSYGRFCRIARLLRDYDPTRDVPAADFAFRVLREVSVDDTRRSVVYDAGHERVLWMSKANPEVRWLDLGTLDFSPGRATRIIDADAGGPGDVSSLLRDYTIEANRATVLATAGPRDDPATAEKLRSRGLTFDEAVELIARHPTLLAPGPER